MDDRITFVCTRAEHQMSDQNDALTMHEDRWAYCASGSRGPHEWLSMPAGAMSFDDAKRFLAQHLIRPARSTDQRSD